MHKNMKKVEITYFNPYEARHPGHNVVPREAILLAKRLRLEGFQVNIDSQGAYRVSYTVRKGFSDILADPVVLKVTGVAATVVIGLVTSWLYDLIKRSGVKDTIPEDLSIAIEVENDGSRIRYDHKGREISDERFSQLLDAMKHRQEAYAASMKVDPPDPLLPYPVYLEHTTTIVGWANLKYVEGKGLMVHPAKITNRETWNRIERGELGGFSIAGIVEESTCQTCKKDYRDCNHGAELTDRCLNRRLS